MWRLLLQAGAGAATFNIGLKIARLKRTVVFLAVAGVLALLGLGALTALAIIALAPSLGALGAAGAVGVGLLLIAALVAFIGTRAPRVVRKPPLVERFRTEIGAAGAAFASTRAANAMSEPREPPPPDARRKKALNMILIATLAGVVLGRRL